MLKTLAMRGFRGFESYVMNDLTTVNLIVGKNNCGKTTVLEAVELLVSNGHPTAFARVALHRDEMLAPTPRYDAEISHLFSGSVCEPGTRFELTSSGKHDISVTILALDEIGEEMRKRSMLHRQDDEDDEPVPQFGLRIETGADGASAVHVLPVDKEGRIPYESWRKTVYSAPSEPPVRFLGMDSRLDAGMRDAWNGVIAEGRENEIAQDLQFLVPDIASIHFLASDRLRSGSTILVGRHKGGRRMPIGSYGDGLRRLLALRLALQGANHGYLLIDEIDSGFHWTVMEDMWRLLVEVAKESDVQIFATTHSLDCIRGLGSLVNSRPDLSKHVSIQKVHPALTQAVSFAGEQIAIAVEQAIELR